MNNWKGETCVILASGPSLTPEHCETVRAWHAHGRGRAMVINTTWESARWADLLYGCATWWAHNHKLVAPFGGQMWCENKGVCDAYKLQHVISMEGEGLSLDPAIVFRGGGGPKDRSKSAGHSGYQAINLAYHFGVRRIVLLGYDMHKDGNGRKNHHRRHTLNIDSPYEAWVRHFPPLANDLRREGVEVFNATPGSAVTCFPMIELSEALRVRTVLAA